MKTEAILSLINLLLTQTDIDEIKANIQFLYNELKADVSQELLIFQSEEDCIEVKTASLLEDLQQIIEAQSLERAVYYLKRLDKGLKEIRKGNINDLNLNRWKDYDDIWTDSLWMLDKRDNSGAHSAGYWGNFVPQIPHQLIRRFTKKHDWILDTFLGSGTTLIECKRLGRNAVGVELQPEVAQMASENIDQEPNPENIRTEIWVGDNLKVDYTLKLQNLGITEVQMVLMHPPYWDIIQYSNHPSDLSNAEDLADFLYKMGILTDKVSTILAKGRILALIISDKYEKGEWIPLGFYTMQEVLKRDFRLKSIVVKNFEETKGKFKQKELWRYRALVGGFYVFKHEYIYLFEKK
jgi:16S rRNA G966 N2-methylase RsmD